MSNVTENVDKCAFEREVMGTMAEKQTCFVRESVIVRYD